MVTLAQPPTAPSTTEPGAHQPMAVDVRPLDILFLQDATGSQGPYIKSARSAIQDICEKISASTALSEGAIRFGLIAFRDHPPQDSSYVTKNFKFTSDVGQMKKNLASLIASGGGDGPEAQTAALAEALNMEWAENAVKIVVMITDSPPHGIGEHGDGFLKSPDQNDPLDIVRQMAERGITLYVIGCEPTLSQQYMHAVDFYRAICQITTGRLVPLLNVSQLGDYIVASAVETIETENLISEFEHVILEDVYGQGKSVEEVMDNVQQQMYDRKVQINTMQVPNNVYEPSRLSEYNTKIWTSSPSIDIARSQTKSAWTNAVRGVGRGGFSPMSSFSGGGRERGRGAAGGGRGSAVGFGILPTLYDSPPTPAVYSPDAFSWTPVPYASSGGGGLFGGGVATGAPASSGLQQQQYVDRSQTKRIVMQSLMRHAKVGPGNVLTPTGEYAAKAPQAPEETLVPSPQS